MAARTDDSRETVLRARNLLKRAQTAAELRAAQAVLFVSDYGLSLQQTAAMLGCSPPTVGRLRRWLDSNPQNGQSMHEKWGGRRRQNLSPEEEKRFLGRFQEQARNGEAITVKAIRQAYETRLGRIVPDSTIYRLLQRHGWHKVTRGAYADAATRNAAKSKSS
jgi:transposase